MRTCWYCARAFREDCSTVSCDKDFQFHARSYVCPYFIECMKKKYAPDEKLGI